MNTYNEVIWQTEDTIGTLKSSLHQAGNYQKTKNVTSYKDYLWPIILCTYET